MDRIIAEIGPHEDIIRGALRRRGLCPDDVNDVIQEAWCRLMALPDLANIEKPAAYFRQIIKNLRLRQREREHLIRFEPLDDHATALTDAGPWSSQRQDQFLHVILLDRLMSDLPDRCRFILRKRSIEGHSQSSIAASLGISEAMVENEGVKARRLLARALGQAPTVQQGRKMRRRKIAGS